MTEERRFFLDTDIGPDCDDAAALALAILYARQCGGKLIGVTHCTSNPWGVGAIRAIQNWYGEAEIPVGTLKDEGFLCAPGMERYNKPLALTVRAAERQAEDAQKVIREVLSEQPDHSVEFISIGPLRNLGNLLTTQDGYELVKRKVRRLVMMAGNFEREVAEWNVEMDIPAARLLAEKWPSEMIYCGWEVGAPVVSLKEPLPLNEKNPVRVAYRLYSNGVGRNSWDLCTVQWAIQPECGFYKLSEPGVIEIDTEGVSRWHAAPNGKHYYLSLNAQSDVIAAAFEDTLIAADGTQGGIYQ